MMVLLLDSPKAVVLEARLARLSLSVQRFDLDEVMDLGRETSESVYMVPFEVLAEPSWPPLRVRLSQANRYYVVAGDRLDSAQIIHAARDGAYDVLQLSDTDPRWAESLKKAADSQTLWIQLYGGGQIPEPDTLLGQSPAMKSLRQAIERLGPTVASVLILGESGVGKERVASALHAASGRGPFVAVNCAAIPKELMEAELFGAEKGAYTGATKTRPGLVEQASGGTLFLDEIGELEVRLQPKILRFLETRKARRVGGNAEIQSEVRVLSATNSNLETEIAQGRFRSDLYYRLSEVILHVPPLRARPEDLPQFAMAFLQAAGERAGKYFESVEPELFRKFKQYDWPGNVRELRNAIDRMVILYDGPALRAAWWEPPRSQPANSVEPPTGVLARTPPATGFAGGASGPMNRRQKLDLARQLVESSGNDLTWVAAQLGIHPTTLYRWRKSGKV